MRESPPACPLAHRREHPLGSITHMSSYLGRHAGSAPVSSLLGILGRRVVCCPSPSYGCEVHEPLTGPERHPPPCVKCCDILPKVEKIFKSKSRSSPKSSARASRLASARWCVSLLRSPTPSPVAVRRGRARARARSWKLAAQKGHFQNTCCQAYVAHV